MKSFADFFPEINHLLKENGFKQINDVTDLTSKEWFKLSSFLLSKQDLAGSTVARYIAIDRLTGR